MKKITLINTLLASACCVGIGTVVYHRIDKEYEKLALEYHKRSLNYRVLYMWLKRLHSGKRLEDYFISKGYKNVAIYGMGDIGELLCEELESSSIRVNYGIDRDYKRFNKELRIYGPEDNLPVVDVIVVTPVFYFDEIRSILKKSVNCPVISLHDVFY